MSTSSMLYPYIVGKMGPDVVSYAPVVHPASPSVKVLNAHS